MKKMTIAGIFSLGALIAVSTVGAVETGKSAPEFQLSTYAGELVSLETYKDEIVVLEWFAHDCEFVGSHYKKGDGHMQKLQADFTAQGIVWLTIDSNRNALASREMQALARGWNMHSTAFLSDPTGEVGRAYGVVTTPQMFIIAHGKIVYQGAIDDRSSFMGFVRDRSTALNYVRQALDELGEGKSISIPETKSYGCIMKYAE